MVKKPEGDLGSMTISKAKAVDTVPFGVPPSAPSAGFAVKSLTVKLEGDLYASLRAHCYEQERVRGTRLTHQEVMVSALKAFLGIRS
jgi:hypothetical protein